VRAYVEADAQTARGRLFADGDRNKLWITNADARRARRDRRALGKDGKQVGLFVLRLPDARRPAERPTTSSAARSATGARVQPRTGTRALHFATSRSRARPIQADGVEVLFYCLRMGRCMLAAMAAGYQRMFAADRGALRARARRRRRPVIKHELPRLHLGRMLGGACSRAR
jgi:hypothetical protein